MRSQSRASALVLMLATLASGQPARLGAQVRDGGSAAMARVTRALADIDSALATRDTARLATALSPSFRWIGAGDGRVDTRETWLAKAAAGLAVAGTNGFSVRSLHGQTLTLHGQPQPHTAIRTSHVRLVTPSLATENWFQQTVVLVQERGRWLLALGQGTYLFSGPLQDSTVLARYVGTYVTDSAQVLTLQRDGQMLMATYPDGARGQVFLRSPSSSGWRWQALRSTSPSGPTAAPSGSR